MTAVRPLPQTRAGLAAMIDRTLLSPGATEDEVRRHCGEALELGVFAHAPAVKAAEAELAWREGARELDVVMNLAHVLAGAWERVMAEIEAVRAAAPDATPDGADGRRPARRQGIWWDPDD